MNFLELIARIANDDRYTDHEKATAISVLTREAVKISRELAHQAAIRKHCEAIVYGYLISTFPVRWPVPIDEATVLAIVLGFANVGVFLVCENGFWYVVS